MNSLVVRFAICILISIGYAKNKDLNKELMITIGVIIVIGNVIKAFIKIENIEKFNNEHAHSFGQSIENKCCIHNTTDHTFI